MTNEIREGHFYTLSVNKVTGDRDYIHHVFEVLGVNDTHAIIRQATRMTYTYHSLFGGPSEQRTATPNAIVVLRGEFDWTPCDAAMLAGIVENGSPVDVKNWFREKA